jgi:uncharacterized protein (TIGR03382 family)
VAAAYCPESGLTISVVGSAGTGAPMFVGGADASFRLLASSGGIDQGDPTIVADRDFDGVLGPVDGDRDGSVVIDIGAYEFVPATIDAGSDAGASDGGANDGGIADGGSISDGGFGSRRFDVGCGCQANGLSLAAFAVALLAVRVRRRR